MTIRSYVSLMRLDKPIGIWLVFFPAAWAVALAAPKTEIGHYLLLMLAGAIVTRAAGCILNDLADRTLDAQVERTKHRPLASGAIKVWQAVAVLIVLLSVALAIALSLPMRAFYLALVAVPMIAAYPWMKRITGWPQAFLGLTFNLGALFAWMAVCPTLPLAALLLYLACVAWTLGYDTVYAIQDMADDATVGIRSSARTLGLPRVRRFVDVCYGILIGLLMCVGLLMDAGAAFYIAIALACGQIQWQIRQLPCTPERAGTLFRSNQWLGLLLLTGFLVDRWL